jgi:D-sedoheptulose 7-phosphate isomerase
MIDQLRANIDAHIQAVQQLTSDHIETIVRIADAIVSSINSGGKLMLAGNGGSAADAQHIAGEFIGRFLYDRRPLPAIALSTDTSVLTCVGNDYSYDDVFARQVEALGCDGDVFWGLSTSGNSANVVAAAEAAKRRGATVVGFTGRKGGKLAKIADLCLAVPADRTDRIQELHMLAYHLVCQLSEEKLCPR